jgi:opacity protein-like surface antigen
MKKGIRSAALVLAVGMYSTTAYASDEGDWYVAASGTASLLNDSHTVIGPIPVPPGYAETENRMDTGYGAQLAIGRRIGNARVEIEGGYTDNKSKHYTAIVPPTGDIASEGGHKAWRAMANVYYDFGSGDFRPYLGGGIGYADIKARFFAARAPFPNEAPFLIMNDHKGEFAYQAMAGVAYQLSPRVALTAQYRWLSAGKVHFRDLAGVGHVREHKGSNIDVGIRFGF